jgi:hypothetical protein
MADTGECVLDPYRNLARTSRLAERAFKGLSHGLWETKLSLLISHEAQQPDSETPLWRCQRHRGLLTRRGLNTADEANKLLQVQGIMAQGWRS